MGRPPHGGGPVFRFTASEVAEMESCLNGSNNAIPSREAICALAEKFSASADRVGKITVQSKQVWNWFQNRRYAQRSKSVKVPAKLSITTTNQEEVSTYRNASNSIPNSNPAPALALAHAPPHASGRRNSLDNNQMEFEAKSARDGAWYDVGSFLSHRMFETGDPEVLVRFTGFGIEEDEWVNVRKCVRLRSLPCEPSECVVVLPGDLILCFQEGKDQALYFDAHIRDAQRRRHDIRGCRCRFLVQYLHDESEEIVPLRKICRRPETDYRLQILHASKALGPVDARTATKDSHVGSSKSIHLSVQKPREQQKVVDVNAVEVVATAPQSKEASIGEISVPIATPSASTTTADAAQASHVELTGSIGQPI